MAGYGLRVGGVMLLKMVEGGLRQLKMFGDIYGLVGFGFKIV